jgi:cytochrome c556
MRILVVIALVGAVCLTATACAPRTPNDAVLTRRATMKAMEKSLSEIKRLANGDLYARRSRLVAETALLNSLARKPWRQFDRAPAHASVGSRASPAIWTNPAGFRAAQGQLIDAVDRLNAISRNGDRDLISSRVGDVAATCSGCHDAYRSKRGF